jgi:hypothetical protein
MNDKTEHDHHWEGQFEEYKILRSKAQELVKRLDELERNTAVACSAIFVFALSNQAASSTLAKLILFILPSLVAGFGYFKYLGLSGYLRDVNDYAANLENAVIGHDSWLKYYYSTRAARCGEYYFRRFRRGTWAALICLCVVLSTILCIFQR